MRSPLFMFIPVLVACTTDPKPSTSDLQMHDLSVMLPLPTSQAELDAMLVPTSPGKDGVLLPQALFSHDTSSGPIEYAALRLVAFRFDPCFGTKDPIGEPDKCENQLRAVFQPLRPDGSNHLVADDAAVHVFYKLTREQLVSAVHEMIDARVAAGVSGDLGPLAPHSIVAQQGLDGTLAKRFEQIITTYAGEHNIVKFTSFVFLSLEGGRPSNLVGQDQFWTMHGNDVANGQLTPIQIAGMPANTIDLSLGINSVPLSTRTSPSPTAADDITLLANFTQAMDATPAQRQAAFDAALRIENPTHHTPNTTDCASCHMAEPSRELVGHALDLHEAANANTFAAASWIPTADLASTTHLLGGDNGLNIHAFSYRAADPMINERVINETAGNLAYLADLFARE